MKREIPVIGGEIGDGGGKTYLAHRRYRTGVLESHGCGRGPCRCEHTDKQNTTRRETVRPKALVRYGRYCSMHELRKTAAERSPLFRMAVIVAIRSG